MPVHYPAAPDPLEGRHGPQTWLAVVGGQPAPISDLTAMQEGAGYMILMGADCLLTYGGNSWQLSSGWNFIGWV